jgi:hypothetical protein
MGDIKPVMIEDWPRRKAMLYEKLPTGLQLGRQSIEKNGKRVRVIVNKYDTTAGTSKVSDGKGYKEISVPEFHGYKVMEFYR